MDAEPALADDADPSGKSLSVPADMGINGMRAATEQYHPVRAVLGVKALCRVDRGPLWVGRSLNNGPVWGCELEQGLCWGHLNMHRFVRRETSVLQGLCEGGVQQMFGQAEHRVPVLLLVASVDGHQGR